jgi:hypothetical protein
MIFSSHFSISLSTPEYGNQSAVLQICDTHRKDTILLPPSNGCLFAITLVQEVILACIVSYICPILKKQQFSQITGKISEWKPNWLNWLVYEATGHLNPIPQSGHFVLL